MNKEQIAPRLFEVLDGANQGFYEAFLKLKYGKIMIFYEGKDEAPELFLDIDFAGREITFHKFPKSYSAEQACINLADDLRKEDFRVRGLDSFIMKPQFREKGGISLY